MTFRKSKWVSGNKMSLLNSNDLPYLEDEGKSRKTDSREKTHRRSLSLRVRRKTHPRATKHMQNISLAKDEGRSIHTNISGAFIYAKYA